MNKILFIIGLLVICINAILLLTNMIEPGVSATIVMNRI